MRKLINLLVGCTFIISCTEESLEDFHPNISTGKSESVGIFDPNNCQPAGSGCGSHSSFVGQVWCSEKETIVDGVTGRERIRLTSGNFTELKLYQTHPNWTFDGKYIIFLSTRVSDGTNCLNQIYALEISSGKVIQLTNHPHNRIAYVGNGSTHVTLSRTSYTMYYMIYEHGRWKLHEQDISWLVNGGSIPAPRNFHTRPADSILYVNGNDTIPADVGGVSLDANEEFVYFGWKSGSIYKVDKVQISDGSRSNIFTSNSYSASHIQANPWISDLVLFSQSEGAPPYDHRPQQRMFIYEGGQVRQLMNQPLTDVVNHEVWVNQYTVAFNLTSTIRNNECSRTGEQGTGIYDINIYTGAICLNDEVPTPIYTPNPFRYIHVASSPDGSFLIGDAGTLISPYNEGQLWRIDRVNGEAQLLSGDADMKVVGGWHQHQSVSPDNQFVLFNYNRTGDARSIMMMPVN